MNVFILRHGLAVEHGAPGYSKDADRPLTPKGERKLGRIVEAMEALELSFDMILSSPYTRARQTAEIVADALEISKRLELAEELAPGGNFNKLIESITHRKSPPEDVLLVGHEPYLSEFISTLVGGDSGLRITMKKGGLCKLSTETLKPGRATLEWLLTPRQMCFMG